MTPQSYGERYPWAVPRSMRVLLMTQTGSERPKVTHSPPDYYGPTELRFWLSEFVILMQGERAIWWKKYQKAAKDADRWWLVECANADAGRAIIASHDGSLACPACAGSGYGGYDSEGDPIDPCEACCGEAMVAAPAGRILASGGAKGTLASRRAPTRAVAQGGGVKKPRWTYTAVRSWKDGWYIRAEKRNEDGGLLIGIPILVPPDKTDRERKEHPHVSEAKCRAMVRILNGTPKEAPGAAK